MRKRVALLLLGLSVNVWAANTPFHETPQNDFERSIEAVVRDKQFYKAEHVELGLTAGVMPYDSLINHYLVGGRATWHISDHFGWEVADFQFAFPSTTSFLSDLVANKDLSNVQTVRLKFMVATNFLVSPMYGKIRLWGANVAHFDVYLAFGGGAANTDTIKEVSQGPGLGVGESVVRTGFDPMFDVGLGFKFYVNNAFGIVADLRDYVTYSQTYGNKALKSNFSVFFGISFFLPTFG